MEKDEKSPVDPVWQTTRQRKGSHLLVNANIYTKTFEEREAPSRPWEMIHESEHFDQTNTIFLNFQNIVLSSVLFGCLENQNLLHFWLQEVQTVCSC